MEDWIITEAYFDVNTDEEDSLKDLGINTEDTYEWSFFVFKLSELEGFNQSTIVPPYSTINMKSGFRIAVKLTTQEIIKLLKK